MTRNDLKIKPVEVTERCFELLNEAIIYLRDKALAPTQAEIMNDQFFAAIKQLETTPWIGIPYKKGMKAIKLGKFSYNIFYRENENDIDILGIWHTSRGTEFEEN